MESFRFLDTTISQDLKWDIHKWESVLCTSIIVWLSSATNRRLTEGSPVCWANHWYNPPHSPRTVLIQSEQKSWQNHSGPLTSSTLPLWTVLVDATELWAPERPDTGTVSSLRQSIQSNILYAYLSNTHTWSTLQFHIIYLYIQNCLL